jgi:anaerobic selenocysteine-containing dehydrogenase
MYGTNNLPDCSNLCHESSGAALGTTIGIGKGTVLLDDFDHADVIVVIGQNPGTNHPRMLTALQRAKERGATIVSINPLRETGLVRVRNPQDLLHGHPLGQRPPTGTAIAAHFLPVRIGGDLALLTGVQKALLERDRDGARRHRPGVRRRTTGRLGRPRRTARPPPTGDRSSARPASTGTDRRHSPACWPGPIGSSGAGRWA